MTLNEAIEHGKNQLEIFGGEHKEFIKTAIEIMRKYQQIEQIIKDDTYYEEYGNNAEKFIVSAISEVLEDGNDD